MFKKKSLGLLILLGVMFFLPTALFAQSEDDLLYEWGEDINPVEWGTEDDWEYDWDSDDTYDYEPGTAIATFATLATVMGVILIPLLVVGLGTYVYTSIAYMKIAKKLNHPNPWFAWVPILNFVLILQLADMSPWLILLGLIPGVNGIAMLILSVMTMMKICEKSGMDKNLGFLMLIPVANLVLPGLVAWKKD